MVVSACVTPGEGGGSFPLAGIGERTAGAVSPSENGPAREAVRRLLEEQPALLTPHPEVVRPFYEQRGFQPAWTTAEGLDARGRQVRAVLETAWADGLAGIAVPPTPPEGAVLDAEARAALDIALTAALADYAMAAIPLRPAWAPASPDAVPTALVTIAADDPAAERPGRLFRLVSEDDRYARLRRGLLRYQALVEAGGWPAVPAEGPKVEPGDRHADLVAVRERLRVSGDLATDSVAPDTSLLDPALAAAIERFQARHGLLVDGIVGRRTRAALAVPAEARVRQMALNLRRLRDMPPPPAGRSVEVNIAGAALEGRQDGVPAFRTDVIVGMEDRPTPRLRSAINRLVLNPTWTVPTSIAEKDLLPKLRENPEYLTENNFTVFDGWSRDAEKLDPTTIDWHAEDLDIRGLRLRQAPGQSNALGAIKFMFPNEHNVYLHSTPSRGLFARSQRTFSSGCVRVRDPLDFATFLMNEPATWTPDAFKRRIADGKTKAVHPRESVPVALVYLTAWVDEDGTAQFRRDVYGYDARELETMGRTM
ncbi:L,D-transpeptidase family protein [uncultured Rhodospira sp.]|uniref:L,D-transpeptidase family protein n=1 Tax=uncultured Rhodospira sp. TaxID=1936189 RepID=UPI00262F8BC4|nr:L,D-transpeptidase family protein [uncultured Rhodospira sp.]